MNPEQNNKPEEPKVQVEEITPQNTVQSSPVEKPENDKEINWSKFKEARAKERKEAEETARRAKEKEAEAEALKAALEALVNKPLQNNSDEHEETEEQKIEKRVEAILAKREAEYENKRRQAEAQEMPQRLVSTFKDFNQVCTTENLDYLEYHYPEVASAFKNLPDSFDKWANLYSTVKRFVPNTDRVKDIQKAEQNMNKPQSPSRAGLSQSTTPPAPNILSDERKASNWERMQRTLKGLS